MKVRFETYGRIRAIIGKKEVELEFEEGTTIERAIKYFARSFGSELESLLFNDGKLASFFSIQVDSKTVDSNNLTEIQLTDDQTISIIPFVAGG